MPSIRMLNNTYSVDHFNLSCWITHAKNFYFMQVFFMIQYTYCVLLGLKYKRFKTSLESINHEKTLGGSS